MTAELVHMACLVGISDTAPLCEASMPATLTTDRPSVTCKPCLDRIEAIHRGDEVNVSHEEDGN